jgi:16S rRNA pseudouridine516 synthase
MRIDTLIITYSIYKPNQIKALLRNKRLLVNGRPAKKISENVDPRVQVIELDGDRIVADGHRYAMLNKPVEVVSANRDADHQTVMDLVENPEGLVIVGRLDYWSSGLMLLTDNTKLGRTMTAPESHVSKTYVVTTKEPIESEDVAHFASGLVIDGDVVLKPAELEILNDHQARVTIHEGKNRQIRKMFLAVGKLVVGLKREAIGDLVLDPQLAPGQSRELTVDEIARLVPYFN